MSFMHGAQDGQKFIGVLMLGIVLANGGDNTAGVQLPIWMMLLCSVVMGLGTSVGGKKIIKSVGMDMGAAGKVPGFFRRYCFGALPVAFPRFLVSRSARHIRRRLRSWASAL